MQKWGWYCFILLAAVVSLHLLLQHKGKDYSASASLSALSAHFNGWMSKPPPSVQTDLYFEANATLSLHPRANATFVILARNSNLEGTIKSIRDIEKRFNSHRGYPYVLLNEEPFSEEFRTRVAAVSGANMEFGVIPSEHWFQPNWIDDVKAEKGREKMQEENVIYGGSVSYRNMCRFNSGFFFKHELMQKYRWYWRIEPDVEFLCDITFDPFVFMRDNNKIYAFTISLYEFEKTIPSLWAHVRNFTLLHPQYIAENNAMNFLSEDEGETYNLCHFWSNFEIADMNFWRGPAYSAFFDYLDSQGGFYYERWGDAPVHSIAAALFASRDQIQFFDAIGYKHRPFSHCPERTETQRKGNCICSAVNFDYHQSSCLMHWKRANKPED